jgi:hypothetical protein
MKVTVGIFGIGKKGGEGRRVVANIRIVFFLSS